MREKITIAVDAMGGDNSPKKIIEGIKISLIKNPNLKFLLFGDKKILVNYLGNEKNILQNIEIHHCSQKVEDDESPLSGAKKGNSTSMWQCIEAQKKLGADISLSAGNTGALLVTSKMILDTIKNIDKPALAGMWPHKNGTNIVLDLGANLECSDKTLVNFCNMGAALRKSLFPEDPINVALLNIGTEETKGNESLKKAYTALKEKPNVNYNFSGFIEGNKIMKSDANVIVTDGWTGNIALKTAEGTATFISNYLKDSLTKNFITKLSSFFVLNIFKKFKKKFDPRKYNGAIFLGLNGPVVKSHGSTDSLGFAYSIKMCNKIVKGELLNKIKKNFEDSSE